MLEGALESRRERRQVNLEAEVSASTVRPNAAPDKPIDCECAECKAGTSAEHGASARAETRSISALTMRSTSPGRLSSSQDFSIGRSISLTRSSSVRALLLSTVLASELKADPTGGDGRARQDLAAARRGLERRRLVGGLAMQCLAAASVNSMIVLRLDLVERRLPLAAASGSAISSVSSNTSPSGCGGLMSASGVASSRLASIASMSSWLLLAAGAGAGGGGGGRGCGAWQRPAGGAGAIADGGISFITAWLAARRLGFAGCGGAGWFRSSRRLGLVVGDDATDRRQNLLHRGLLDLCRLRHLRLHIETILHQSHEGIAGSGYAGRDFHRTSPDLSPDQAPPDASRGDPAPVKATRSAAAMRRERRGANRSARPRNGTSWPQLIASKAPGALQAPGDDVIPQCAEL